MVYNARQKKITDDSKTGERRNEMFINYAIRTVQMSHLKIYNLIFDKLKCDI